ncbi:hypothetical protein SMSP2_02301 [Limihaloglobus sulfuriphilus]|uniref:Uncharacterized protein n=1 Tax=Limihaloglobus sulfuriphilus TaxID=1851148 RepID=A0A1Q2MI35_9BACT|nr:hypothetical protein [Limihaloglobus sulfuriphilus]AQQ71922.1 hypothetical protein SMSP2_02301 [Limihaloglobus sulfuriphilus]
MYADDFQKRHLEEGERVRREIYRNMSAEQKIRILEDMYWTARQMKTNWLKQQHPDWTDEEIEKEVREIFLCGRA